MTDYKMTYGCDTVTVTLGMPEEQVLIDGESFGRQFADFSTRVEPAMRAAAAHVWGKLYETEEEAQEDGRDAATSPIVIWENVAYEADENATRTEAISKAVTRAIERSISHNEIVTLRADESASYEEFCAALKSESDDDVENGDVHEFWGTDDGDDWRVHVRAS